MKKGWKDLCKSVKSKKFIAHKLSDKCPASNIYYKGLQNIIPMKGNLLIRMNTCATVLRTPQYLIICQSWL